MCNIPLVGKGNTFLYLKAHTPEGIFCYPAANDANGAPVLPAPVGFVGTAYLSADLVGRVEAVSRPRTSATLTSDNLDISPFTIKAGGSIETSISFTRTFSLDDQAIVDLLETAQKTRTPLQGMLVFGAQPDTGAKNRVEILYLLVTECTPSSASGSFIEYSITLEGSNSITYTNVEALPTT